jgi:hypothetical protein
MEGARYLEDGRLTVFLRGGTYYARIRIRPSGRYVSRSLRTSDEQAAIREGRRLLFQLEQRAERGLPPKSKLLSAVIDDYIAYRQRDHAHGKTSAGMLRQIIRVSSTTGTDSLDVAFNARGGAIAFVRNPNVEPSRLSDTASRIGKVDHNHLCPIRHRTNDTFGTGQAQNFR